MDNKDRRITTAVILAAGSGSRMQCDKTKQNIEIFGESILERSVRAFEECAAVDNIVVVARAGEKKDAETCLSRFEKVRKVVIGGATRRDSAKAGFYAVPSGTELVAIHDAARCLVTPEMIEKVVAFASVHKAASAVSPIVDTVKLTEGGFITATLPREKLYAAATPQVFLVDLYKKALEITENDVTITDDNMMIEKLGEKVFCVDVGSENLKITTRSDLDLAEYIIGKRMRNE